MRVVAVGWKIDRGRVVESAHCLQALHGLDSRGSDLCVEAESDVIMD